MSRFLKCGKKNTLEAQTDYYLVVGLGNPGREYTGNRHNIGFQCVDRLSRELGVSLGKKRFKAIWGEGRCGRYRIVLCKPQTFMNSSGESVAALRRWFKVPPENVLVIHDDLDLPLGKIRLRPGGSSGGHRGIESIIARLGTRDFRRVRIGIGRPEYGDPVDYVLADFRSEDESMVAMIRDAIVEIVPYILENGIQEAMNCYNSRQLMEA